MQTQTKLYNEPFHTYYDISILNNTPDSGAIAPQIVYDKTWTGDGIIKNASDYFVSVARFNVQTTNALPAFIAEPLQGSSNINDLIYQVGIIINQGPSFDATQKRVTYLPTTDGLTLFGNNTGSKLGNPYYYVYNINHFIKMINNALEFCCVTRGIDVCFMVYDETTTLCQMYVPSTWQTFIQIHFNAQLQNLFDGFDWTFENNFKLLFNQETNIPRMNTYKDSERITTTTQQYGTKTYYILRQTFSTLPVMNPVQSIVFVTSLLPVNQTLSTPQVVYGDSQYYPEKTSNSSGNDVSPIITDFIVPCDALGSQYKANILYQPNGEYRLFDLVANDNIKSVQLEIKWKDKYNNIRNLQLASGNSCNIKLMFRRKDYNNVTL
jgi:hypothetical protein